ncbi:MAG: alpha/beta fold hydrolase [Pleurocapsa sp. SU_5_0]|nr:alpha/beta fold hydrolase [Pleurocapsa sp. SU_5_0]
MLHNSYSPPWFLDNGFLMTIYVAMRSSQIWQETISEPEPHYQKVVFTQGEVPLAGWVAIPPNPQGTIVGTYGITGTLDNQWFLRILARKAYAQNYAVVLFDWRAHGESAKLSSVLTSDGINEGKDFVSIAGESKTLGCPAPFWFTGYSLGGQLALWGIYYAQFLAVNGLNSADVAGGAVICPNLDSNLSLPYLMKHPTGKYIEQAIAKELSKLVLKISAYHPQDFERSAIEKANSIWGFDHHLVVPRLGFDSVEDYYTASSPFQILPKIEKPTLILYAEDDPMFAPSIIPRLKSVCHHNEALNLILTKAGGHVGYVSSLSCQQKNGDRDCWWGWNQILNWIGTLNIEH